MGATRYESMLREQLEPDETLVAWIDAGGIPAGQGHRSPAAGLARREGLDMARVVPVAGGCLVGVTGRRLIAVEPGRDKKPLVDVTHPGTRLQWWDVKGMKMFGTITRRYVLRFPDDGWLYVETIFRRKRAAPYEAFVASFGDDAEERASS